MGHTEAWLGGPHRGLNFFRTENSFVLVGIRIPQSVRSNDCATAVPITLQNT